MAQLMPLPLTVSCFSKIQIGFTFLVPAHPGSPGLRAVKRVCVCVCVCMNKQRCIEKALLLSVVDDERSRQSITSTCIRQLVLRLTLLVEFSKVRSVVYASWTSRAFILFRDRISSNSKRCNIYGFLRCPCCMRIIIMITFFCLTSANSIHMPKKFNIFCDSFYRPVCFDTNML